MFSKSALFRQKISFGLKPSYNIFKKRFVSSFPAQFNNKYSKTKYLKYLLVPVTVSCTYYFSKKYLNNNNNNNGEHTELYNTFLSILKNGYKASCVQLDSETAQVAESIIEEEDLITAPAKVPPFSRIIELPDDDDSYKNEKSSSKKSSSSQVPISFYKLIGIGARSVSFLKINVYAVGIYICTEDLPKVNDILKTVNGVTSSTSALKMFNDNKESQQLINSLIIPAPESIRFALRIVPVRNTDFGHLRDGFIKSVLNNQEIKLAQSENDHTDEINNGLNQLRNCFSRKLSVPKHQELILRFDKSATVHMTYFDGKKHMLLGTITEPIITQALLAQYLSAHNPSSPTAQKEAVSALSSLVV